MRTIAFETAEALGEALALRVLTAVEKRPALVLGLPTGRTPLPFYAAVRRLSRQRETDWSHVRTFNLDEFVGVDATDRGSYRAYMQRELFDHVNLLPAHIGFLDGKAADLEAECTRYDAEIARAGGIDLMLLGIGGNGHIGFNEPAPSLEPRTHRVRLLAPTRDSNRALFDGAIERVPTDALSMGMITILQARSVVLIATGAAKKNVVEKMIRGPITTALPASFLQLHPEVTVMLDREVSPR